MANQPVPFDPSKLIEMRCTRGLRPSAANIPYSEVIVWRTVEFVKVLVQRPSALVWDGDDVDCQPKLMEVDLSKLRNVKPHG